jgi:hypothetical protein
VPAYDRRRDQGLRNRIRADLPSGCLSRPHSTSSAGVEQLPDIIGWDFLPARALGIGIEC